MMTPTARTLAYCKSHGMLACVVERYVAPFGRPFGHRVDAFGWMDILVLDGQPGALGVQATDGTSVHHRVAKMRVERSAAVRAWLAAGNRAQVWAWSKKGGAGKRKLWTLKVVHVTGNDLAPVELTRPRGKRRRNAHQLEFGETNGTRSGGQERTT
jgi:hypothetical protein